MDKKMMLFDLDGTLWDSSQQVAESWNIVFRQFGQIIAPGEVLPELSADDIRRIMGKTMDEIALTIMPDMDLEHRAVLFKKCETFEVTYIESHGGMLYPGVRETLEMLKENGYALSVVSNCQEGYVRAFIKSMRMESYFCDYEEWGRTGRSKSENIRLVMERNGCTKGIYVGDTQKDKDAADAAGIPFIWASYGFGTVSSCAGKIDRFSEFDAEFIQAVL